MLIKRHRYSTCIFKTNIYIRLGNRQPKQLKLPKAQGKDQQSFAEADQHLGRKCRHLKLLILRYEDAAAKPEEDTQRTNESTVAETPLNLDSQRTNESTVTETPLISSESRAGSSEGSTDTPSSAALFRNLDSSMAAESTTTTETMEISENEFIKEIHAVSTDIIAGGALETVKIFGGEGDAEILQVDAKLIPTFERFKVPVAPCFIQGFAKDIIKVRSLFPERHDITKYQLYNHKKYYFFSLPLSKSKESFRKVSGPTIRALPRNLVDDAEYNNRLNDVEKTNAIKEKEAEITKWLIQILAETEEGREAVEEIARTDLGMAKATIMPYTKVAALYNIGNVLPTSWRRMKSAIELHFGRRMFASEKKAKSLMRDAVLPVVGQWNRDGKKKIDYWYKPLEAVLLQAVKDQLISKSLHYLRRNLKHIHLVFAGDSGKGSTRAAVKLLVKDGEAEDSKCFATATVNVAHIDDGKDDYETLKATIVPKFDKMMADLQAHGVAVCLPCEEGEDPYMKGTSDDNHGLRNQNDIEVKVKCYVASDYKFCSDVLGKKNRSGQWCMYCKLAKSAWKASSNNNGEKWTQADIRALLAQRISEKNYKMNLGVVDHPLITCIEPECFMFAVLHQLLGTGNDLKNAILKMIDDEFESYPEEMEDNWNAYDEARRLLDEESRRHDRRVEETHILMSEKNLHATRLKELRSSRLRRINELGLPFQQGDFVQMQQEIDRLVDEVTELEELLKEFERSLNVHKKSMTGAKVALNKKLDGRKIEDRTLKLKLHAILNKYKITPQQYHGGDLIGNHIKKFMEHAEMICADVYDFLQEIPVNSRRNYISDEDLKSRMDKFQDLLILADCMYSFCRKECGTMTHADLVLAGDIITKFSSLWRSSGMSVTPKAHTIEKHLLPFLRRFRGLGNHDEKFIERAHQAGIANEKRAANTKEFDKKAMYFALWDRLGENPIVQKEVEWWEDNRRKRKQGDRRNVASAANQHAKRQVKEEGRSAAAARHSL